MAIAFDSFGTGYQTVAGSTISWTHTVNSNTNGIMIVSWGAGSATPSSLKFAGQSLIKIISGSNSTLNNELWYVVAPATGLGTFNGTYAAGAAVPKTAVSAAYTGVDQIDPVLGSATTNGGTAAVSGSVTVTNFMSSGIFVGGIRLNNSPGTTSAGNERGTAGDGTPGDFEEMLSDSTGGTVRWTFPAARNAITGASLNPTGSITVDSLGSISATSGSTFTWGHTVSGNNKLMVVGFMLSSFDGSIVSPIKFAGQNMTRILENHSGAGNTDLWYLVNPPSGLGTIVGTQSAGPTTAGIGMSVSLNGVDQTTPIAGSVSGTTPSTGTSGSVSRSIAANNMMIGFINIEGATGTTNIGAERSKILNVGASNSAIIDTHLDGTIQWSWASAPSAFLGAEINYQQAAGTSTYSTFKTLTGAGNI